VVDLVSIHENQQIDQWSAALLVPERLFTLRNIAQKHLILLKILDKFIYFRMQLFIENILDLVN
jgi:hypothetical protein